METAMAGMLHERKPRHPRATETYRFDRRNHSDLNRDRKTWYGVSGKLRPEPPALILKVAGVKAKHPGETHYVKDRLRT